LSNFLERNKQKANTNLKQSAFVFSLKKKIAYAGARFSFFPLGKNQDVVIRKFPRKIVA